jgi:hypothetical protein
MARRYRCDADCTVRAAGGERRARLQDISEGGATIVAGPDLSVGQRGTLTVAGHGIEVAFEVRSSGAQRLHVSFRDVGDATRSALQNLTRRLSPVAA